MSPDATARLEAALGRVRARNPALRAFVGVTEASARAEAAASDARSASGRGLGPLDGLLVAVKDNLAVAGQPRTAGCVAFGEDLRDHDALAVERLRAAGAVILGRTLMDEAAAGGTGDNPLHGRCVNPLGAGLSPGGSSGGSAVAVAAGLTEAALGTDTLGSVRLPAAFCGIAGLLATRGAVGRSGMRFFAPSLDRIGPMAPDVALLAPMLAALAGPDPRDSGSLPPPAGWPGDAGGGLAGLTLGVPQQAEGTAMEPAAREAFQHAIGVAETLGAATRPLTMTGWHPASLRAAMLLVSAAEAAVALASLRGHPGLGAGLAESLERGAAATSRDLVEALAAMRSAAAAAHRALGEADLLILPTAPMRAFPHGAPPPFPLSLFTCLSSAAGLPALCLPVPLPGEALPGSVQLIGPPWSEGRLLAAGAALQAGLRATSPG